MKLHPFRLISGLDGKTMRLIFTLFLKYPYDDAREWFLYKLKIFMIHLNNKILETICKEDEKHDYVAVSPVMFDYQDVDPMKHPLEETHRVPFEEKSFNKLEFSCKIYLTRSQDSEHDVSPERKAQINSRREKVQEKMEEHFSKEHIVQLISSYLIRELGQCGLIKCHIDSAPCDTLNYIRIIQ